jgi:rhodanese-related sulfurtransferase
MRASIFLMVLACHLFSCNNDVSKSKRISNLEFEALILDRDIQIIDIRTAAKFEKGHIPGARNMVFGANGFDQKLNLFNEKVPVLIYGSVGGRSYIAGKRLVNIGFEEVYDLKNGIKGWKDAGRRITNTSELYSSKQ